MFVDGKILTATGHDRVDPAPIGVRVHKPEQCCPGYTLFSPAMGKTEYLMDMHGLIVHTWPCTHSQLGELLPNGNLMVDNYGAWLEELEPDGTRVWRWEGRYHHDFYVLPNDNIVMLTSEIVDVKPGFYPEGQEPPDMRTDFVVEIDRAGNEVWRFSFLDHIDALADLVGFPIPAHYGVKQLGGSVAWRGIGDWAHLNTIEVLPDTPLGRRDSRFRHGNLLFSMRAIDIIGVIDRDSEEIVWAWGLGVLDGQHQPTMLPNGNILIFDNGTYRGHSAAVEMDPATGEVVWQYVEPETFWSPFRGGVQRLRNGNTLICESDAGRIFEATPDKEIVWDFASPFIALSGGGGQGRHIYRATRYNEEQVAPLFEVIGAKPAGVWTFDGEGVGTFREALAYYQRELAKGCPFPK